MGLTVFTAGTFDLVHSGHVNFLRQCAMLGEVFVALNTDEFIERYKGKRPIMTYQERYDILTEFESVDAVFANSGEENCSETIEGILKTHPIDIIAIGSDWARKDYYKQMGFTQDWLDERGISLIYIPYTKGISTTDLKRRLQG